MQIFRAKRNLFLMFTCALIAVAAGVRWRLRYVRAHVPLQTATVRNPYGGANHIDRMMFSADGHDITVEDISGSLSVWNIPNKRWMFWLEHGAESTDEHVPVVARPFLNSHAPSGVPGFPPPLPKYSASYPLDMRIADYTRTLRIVSPSGNLVAYGRPDNLLSVADLRRKRILFSTTPKKSLPSDMIFADILCAVCFSPDEKLVAVASVHDGALDTGRNGRIPSRFPTQIALRSVQTGAIIHQWTWNQFETTPEFNAGYNLGTIALAFSPDGKSIAVSDDGQISLWSVSPNISSSSTGVLIKRFKDRDDRMGTTRQLIFFRNRPLLASTELGDQVNIWNTRSGRLVQKFYSWTDLMALSPDERRLATSGQDTEGHALLRIWDVSTL